MEWEINKVCYGSRLQATLHHYSSLHHYSFKHRKSGKSRMPFRQNTFDFTKKDRKEVRKGEKKEEKRQGRRKKYRNNLSPVSTHNWLGFGESGPQRPLCWLLLCCPLLAASSIPRFHFWPKGSVCKHSVYKSPLYPPPIQTLNNSVFPGTFLPNQ